MHRTARGTHRLVYLGIAVLAFVLSFIDSNLPLSVQLGFLVGGVALLGLPHGALDPLLASASGVARTGAQLARFMVLYVTAAALVVGLWWLAPVMTLAGFLLLSIWHFRSDWNTEISGSQAIAAAASIICTPALFHPAAVSEIFSALVFGESVQQLVWITRLLGAMALICVAVTIFRITIA